MLHEFKWLAEAKAPLGPWWVHAPVLQQLVKSADLSRLLYELGTALLIPSQFTKDVQPDDYCARAVLR